MEDNKEEDQLLQRKQYLVGITIIEARCILGKDAAGTSDPFVKVRCAGREQQSSKKMEVNTATWQQSLTFEGIMMNQYELETFEMVIELYDHNAILANELIGQYTVGLSTLYRNTDHEFHRVWLGLFRQDEPNKVQAYLQVSCFIVGPNERPPAHSQDEDGGDDALGDDSEEDEEEIAKRIESIKRAQGVVQVLKPATIDKAFQLTVAVDRADELPKPPKGATIRPFVSARVFGSHQITAVKQGIKPKWHAKLQFPIFYPILNDKITMRIWFWNSGLSSNTFLANIPEQPGPSDSFNLSKLFASDRRMPARWINLYGTHPDERSGRTKGRREGTQYLGRVLVAFSLISNERPQLNAGTAQPIKEPKTRHYQLWVDLYELIKCDVLAEDAPVSVVVSIGRQKSERQVARSVRKGGRAFWKWPKKQRQVEAIVEQFPSDLSQVPDIFLDLYTENAFSTTVRFAYLRLRAKDCICSKPKPNWFRLTSPYNDTGGSDIGMLMANIQFLKWEQGVPYKRAAKEKSGKAAYKFYCQVLRGFELASCFAAEDLNTAVDVQIGDLAQTKGTIKTTRKRGRYPVWNELAHREVKLQKELAFEPDMRVALVNESPRLFGGVEDKVIGEFAVPVQSIMQRSLRPQFFNLLNEEGQFMGQVLCNFFLVERDLQQERAAKKQGRAPDPRHAARMEEFEETTSAVYTVDVDIALFGIRNLIQEASQPRVTIRLTHGCPEEQQPEPMLIDEEWSSRLDVGSTRNPNFGQAAAFCKVSLAKEPLCWPYIEIRVDDAAREGGLFSFGGSEPCFTTISLVSYAKDIASGHALLYADAQLHRNQDKLMMVQNQIDSAAVLKQLGAVDLDMNNLVTRADTGGALTEQEAALNNTTQGRGSLRQTVMANGQPMAVLDDRAGGGNTDGQRRQGNLFDDWLKGRAPADEDGDADVSVLLQGRGGKSGDGNNPGFDFGNSADEEEDLGLLPADVAGAGPTNDLERGVVVGEVVEFPVTPKDKAAESGAREETTEKLKAEHVALMRKLKALPVEQQEKKEKLKIKMMDITESIDELRGEEMTELKLWGFLALDDGGGGYDYGREILKGVAYETRMELPYEQLPLFTSNDWSGGPSSSPIVQVGGILRSGKLSGASIKARIRMKESGDDGAGEPEEEEAAPALMPQENKKKDEGKQGLGGGGGDGGDRWEKIKEVCQEVAADFPFDVFEAEYLKKLTRDSASYKVRVYLIGAQNLTATGSKLDAKSRLAGMTAMCVANPYPVLTLGDGKNDDEKKRVKTAGAREDSADGELSPQFWRVYELDAIFPEDWRLEIAIRDKGVVSYADSLIGATVIDVENRHYADPLMLNGWALKMEFVKNKKDMKKAKKAAKGRRAAEQARLRERANGITAALKKMKQFEQFLVPVEYRELMHPQKTQAQGIVETWVEVLTLEESRSIQPQKMLAVSKETYEIRFIVWETRYVPLVDGDKVDIWVRVVWDPTGDPDDYVEKRTDTHYFSRTGWGSFNWRFKFELTVPCDFPRLKVTIFDAGLITDEVIGEGTLNLKKTIDKLEKEGSIAVPKTYITCWNPNKPAEEGGCLMFSMDILPKEEADADPVGESWDEPNENPFLKKPTAGRGVAAALGDGGFNWDFDFDWNPFGKFLPFIIGLLVFLSCLTIIMYWRMFSK